MFDTYAAAIRFAAEQGALAGLEQPSQALVPFAFGAEALPASVGDESHYLASALRFASNPANRIGVRAGAEQAGIVSRRRTNSAAASQAPGRGDDADDQHSPPISNSGITVTVR